MHLPFKKMTLSELVTLAKSSQGCLLKEKNEEKEKEKEKFRKPKVFF